MKRIATYIGRTIHQVLTDAEPSVAMLVETDVYTYSS
jgi:hypothetical protein